MNYTARRVTAFMRHFRRLAFLGATEIVLHHTGKSETSKQYRRSSDIKAAVDTGYLLERPTQQPEELRELSMNCFKARLAPGKDFGMEFQRGRGFVLSNAFRTSKTVTEIVIEVLRANPDCKAKAELAKHVSGIEIHPQQAGKKGHYIAMGEWNLLGGFSEGPASCPTEMRVRMVAGEQGLHSQGIDIQNEQADVLMTVHGLVDSLYTKE